ncbi:MAG: DUF4013 domain-containing protein [Acidobacteriota bacterium]|nr:DUF4013 domain-containing protein [Acidobacteriota bacterium]
MSNGDPKPMMESDPLSVPEQPPASDVPSADDSSIPQTWHLTGTGMETREASLDELRTLLADTETATGDQEGKNYLIWAPGLWSWEPLDQLPRLLAGLTGTEPPAPPQSPQGKLYERVVAAMKRVIEESWGDFRQRITGKNFFGQIWWLLVLQLIPVVGSVINKGWRLELIRTGQSERWPDRMHIGRHFTEGMFLWAMYLLYLVPQFFLLTLIGFDWVEDLVNLAWWAAQNLTTGSSTQTFQEILGGGVVTFLLDSLVLAVYPVVAWPFYRAAMIRYALSGQAKVFWQLVENRRFVKANTDVLLGLYVPQKALWLLCLFLGAVLLSTGILAPLIPLALAPARLALSGLLYQKATRQRYPLAQFFPRETPAPAAA